MRWVARKKSLISGKPLGVNAQRIKPRGFKHYLTIGEVAIALRKDKDWIKKLERAGRLPEAKRVSFGELEVRLYSPEQLQEMRDIFATHRPGRRPA
jgi:hypothetical protein